MSWKTFSNLGTVLTEKYQLFVVLGRACSQDCSIPIYMLVSSSLTTRCVWH